MADMLTIGSQATHAFKKALEVTSHNVANVGTEGYSRQRAVLASNAPQIVGGHTFLGGGSQVTTVERMYADYIQKQLVNSNGLVKGYEQSIAYARQVEGIVASNDQGVQQFMQRYFDSLQNLADLPTSRVNREFVLDQARSLTGHVNNMTTILKETQNQTNLQIQDLTRTINDHLNTIKNINTEVAKSEIRGTQPPNDLLDKREQSIMELSNLIGIKTFNQPNGTIDIYSANARVPLLTDNNLTSLRAGVGEYVDENRTELYIKVNGQDQLVTDLLVGPGELGGVLDFRKNVLDRAQNELGVTLNALVASNNWQQYQGWDENGEPGRNNDLFKPLEVNAFANKNNSTGSDDGSGISVSFAVPKPLPNPVNPPDTLASLGVTYDDMRTEFELSRNELGKLVPREYELRWNGTEFDIFDHITKQKLAPTDLAGNPLVLDPVGGDDEVWLDGLRFDLTSFNTANLNVNDRFVIKPHKAIMEQFSVAMTNGQQIATRGQAPVDSLGNPLVGTSLAEPGAEGDNVNIANMASIQSIKLMYANQSGQASETLLGGYSRMASSVGMFVSSAEVNFDAQKSSFSYINERREILSGVSLDEEAANLLRFQQAYQAAAQIIQASQSMFQTLIGVMRG
ncbi:flagellar hook-associated protein FlgK [Thiomicrospira microaerophila]|uniref:flagellar hook-associated protein FlgK n=1 Tax=Thiomicrospira microaerophila TaxID=406020 RepID=UPI00200F1314|nr:flagellar hook-associated protein FlgK [Thiomicrospira microaerophila]UQB42699.1 flagellar hook-associated protein FlgK [Thiomicrospira microaerophila]